MNDSDPAELRRLVAQSMLPPRLRGVGLCIPKGVDPASIVAPEPTPLDAEDQDEADEPGRPA